MRVDAGKCACCGVCPPYCPMGAISLGEEGLAVIDQDECVECGTCRRSGACPADAFYQPPLTWPRSIRAILSDQTYRPPGAPPRFSSGIKIGDVNGRYPRGYGSVLVEMGRPGIGARFRDLEMVTQALAAHGFTVEKGKSTDLVMADVATGRVKDEVRDEKASRINVEFKVPLSQVPRLVEVLQQIAPKLNTVVSVGIMRRFEADGSLPDLGVPTYPNGKINVGLGRPRAEES